MVVRVGDRGKTLTALRPHGAVRINGNRHGAWCAEGVIEPGSAIVVVDGSWGRWLAYHGFSYATRDKVVDAGPVQVTAEREHTVWIPPVGGGVGVAAGVALLVLGGRKSAV
jgi:hypothetical protein